MKKFYSVIMVMAFALFSIAFAVNIEPIKAEGIASTDETVNADISETADIWDGTTKKPTKITNIDGTNYYEISTAAELAYLAQDDDYLKYNYILKNDIILNDEKLTYDKETGKLTVEDESALNEWTPIGDYRGVRFTGIFNGAGHAIWGVYIKSQSEYLGFFDYCNGDIINLTIKNSHISGGDIIGGICGYFSGNMNNCYFYGAVIGELRVGGLIGECNGNYGQCKIRNSGNYGDVWGNANAKYWSNTKGQSNVAGIAGYSFYGRYDNCFNEGNIRSMGGSAGGVVGYDQIDSRVSDSINSGNIQSNGNYTGGIAGICASIGQCENRGNVIGKDYVGGIAGSTSGISVCQNFGNVSAQGNKIGGIAGNAYLIKKCGNIGNISGNSEVGGICGTLAEEINMSFNNGVISGTTKVGGIVGHVNKNAVVTTCYNIANVSGISDNIGAIIGLDETLFGNGSVSDCYYLKNSDVNSNLNPYGNIEDLTGTESKDESFFCVNDDRTLNIEGHTYSMKCDPDCDNCGLKRTVTHDYTNIKFDQTHHWHECDCGKIDYQTKEEHSGGTANCTHKAICKTCSQEYGEINSSNHSAAEDWTSENGKHYHKCLNGCDAHLDETECSGGTANCTHKAICEICSQEYGEIDSSNHSAAEDWTSENGKHYHKCLNGCDAHLDETECSGGTANCTHKAICKTCSQEYGEIDSSNHSAAEDWTSINGKHYHKCLNGCDARFDEAKCSGGTATCKSKAKCSICGQKYGTVNKSNHTPSDWIVDKKPTTKTNGHQYKVCTECNALLEEEEIDKLQSEDQDNQQESNDNKGGSGCGTIIFTQGGGFGGGLYIGTILLVATISVLIPIKRKTTKR